MTKINSVLFILLLLIFSFSASSVQASGGNRNGTAGASELLIPVGARGIAMGSSALTSSRGLDAIYWNPANLAFSDNTTEVFVSHMNYIADIGVDYGAIGTKIEGFGSIAFTAKALSIGEIAVTTVENIDGTGQTFTPKYSIFGFTYSRELSDRISVGFTANYINEELALVSASGFAFNIGVTYNNIANIAGLDFAIIMKNLGPQMQYDGSGLFVRGEARDFNRVTTDLFKIEAAKFELPSTLEIGLGYQFNINEQNMFNINGLFQNANFYGDEYRIGAEYGYDNLLFLRAGYSVAPDMTTDENGFGLAAGVGINYALGDLNLHVDYAYRQVEFFEDNHIFSVGLGF